MASLSQIALLLSLLSSAYGVDNSTCGNCTITGDAIGIVWTPEFHFLNETVHVVVDVTDNSTTIISTEQNSDASSSYSSLCTSVYDSLVHDWQNPHNCMSTSTFMDVVYDGFNPKWTMTGTYPTTYLNFPALYYNTATMTTVSNKIICTTARRTIFLHTPYAIRPDDKDYFYIFTNMGHAITYLDKIPGGVPSSLGPDFASCSLGPNQGIPTTKIAIFATQSTVYQYKTGERKPSSSAEGNLPVINPPAPPSKPINTPLSTTNVVVVPQPTRTLPTEQTGQHPPPLTSITSAPQPPAITPPPIFIPSADSYRVLPSVAGVVLPNGATLLAGKATTISDTPYSLYSSANQLSLIIGGRTLALQPSRPLQLPTGYQLLPSGGGLILPNGETLKPGSATIVNGIPNSLAPSASFVVVGGVTMTPLSGGGLPSGYSMLGPGDGIGLPNGETLRPGAVTTVGGVLVSLDASNSVLVYGSTTISPSSSTGETTGAVKSAGKTSSISAGGRLEVARVVLLFAIALLTSIFVD